MSVNGTAYMNLGTISGATGFFPSLLSAGSLNVGTAKFSGAVSIASLQVSSIDVGVAAIFDGMVSFNSGASIASAQISSMDVGGVAQFDAVTNFNSIASIASAQVASHNMTRWPTTYFPAVVSLQTTTTTVTSVTVPSAGYSAIIPQYIAGIQSIGSTASVMVSACFADGTQSRLYFQTVVGVYTAVTVSLNAAAIIASCGTKNGTYIASLAFYMLRPSNGTTKFYNLQVYGLMA
jgi:hypothetical protein